MKNEKRMNKCEEGRRKWITVKEEMNKCEEGLALEKAKPERFFPFFFPFSSPLGKIGHLV